MLLFIRLAAMSDVYSLEDSEESLSDGTGVHLCNVFSVDQLVAVDYQQREEEEEEEGHGSEGEGLETLTAPSFSSSTKASSTRNGLANLHDVSELTALSSSTTVEEEIEEEEEEDYSSDDFESAGSDKGDEENSAVTAFSSVHTPTDHRGDNKGGIGGTENHSDVVSASVCGLPGAFMREEEEEEEEELREQPYHLTTTHCYSVSVQTDSVPFLAWQPYAGGGGGRGGGGGGRGCDQSQILDLGPMKGEGV